LNGPQNEAKGHFFDPRLAMTMSKQFSF